MPSPLDTPAARIEDQRNCRGVDAGVDQGHDTQARPFQGGRAMIRSIRGGQVRNT